VYLLDVNTLVALAWPNHVHHGRARKWFRKVGCKDWATTPASQAGFVRVSMNRAVTGTDTSFAAAVTLLERLVQVGTHTLVDSTTSPFEWPEWLTLRIQGHRQVTDAALLVCALDSGRKLATLDERLTDLTGEENRTVVELIPV
jgi:toxin-antitoxin system PIN domain toxin